MLAKKQTLLTVHPEQRSDSHTYFQYENDGEDYRVGYYLPMVDWVEMRCPEQITVTVAVGDQMENDLGLHDAGERADVDWDLNLNMSVADAKIYRRGIAHAQQVLADILKDLDGK